MSKPINEGLLSGILATNPVRREEESLLQILNLLEVLRGKTSEKMARISGNLSEFLDEGKNLEELLSHLRKDKMLKVYELSYLKERFPQPAKDNFFKID
ncbi:hypothetical protein [Campylobacter sp.]|uniref:hypothetical protein n=1 Tax=Campylobacter sp. TaxID=205 RepID=UPI0026DAC1DA|nr:hypothetical protein [Campylobacter sp.]MDO4674830.1 hypothetical protein [Campylobacter sp.]